MYKVENKELYELQPKRSQTEPQVSLNLKIFEQTLNESNVKQDKGFCALMLGLYNYNKAITIEETTDEEVLNKVAGYFKQAKDLGYFCVSSYYLFCIYFKKDEENKEKLEKVRNLLQEAINKNQRAKALNDEVKNVMLWEDKITSKLEKVTEKIKKIELGETLKKNSRTLRNKNKEVKEMIEKDKRLKSKALEVEKYYE